MIQSSSVSSESSSKLLSASSSFQSSGGSAQRTTSYLTTLAAALTVTQLPRCSVKMACQTCWGWWCLTSHSSCLTLGEPVMCFIFSLLGSASEAEHKNTRITICWGNKEKLFILGFLCSLLWFMCTASLRTLPWLVYGAHGRHIWIRALQKYAQWS